MRPLRALAITALAAASLALVPAPSAITATCYGTGCDGQYPAETGCYESAYPIRRDSNDRVQIELWFSTVCQTKWSQVYYNDGGADLLVTGLVGIDFTRSAQSDVPFHVSRMVGASIGSPVTGYIFYQTPNGLTYGEGQPG